MTTEDTLRTLDTGDKVILTVSNTSEYETETLEVVAPNPLPMLEGPEYLYQINKHRGDMVLHHGEKNSKFAPERYYADIVSVDIVEE